MSSTGHAANGNTMAVRHVLIILFGLAMMAAIILAPTPAGLSLAGQRVIAVMAFIVLMWITEAIPYSASAVSLIFLLIVALGFSPPTGLTGDVLGTAKAVPLALSGFSNGGWLFVATKDMLDLAKHIVEQKSGEFDPGKFEDRYEAALVELVNSKRNGTLGKAKATARPGTNVVDLMTALQQSLKGGAAKASAAKGRKAKAATGQREMLLPISGKRAAVKEETKAPAKTGRASSKTRKAG